ncbi:MAG: DNA topoisomerase IB [Planctomycetota bacterium]
MRAGAGFRYLRASGRPVSDPAELKRIRGLVIPPAWRDVWISPDPNSHLQATGRDARGRKQYRYHARWRTVRHETKFDRMVPFGRLLPDIRDRISRDLRETALSKTKVVAAVVQLLEKTLIRVGNVEYAKSNKSFGLTTLRDEHVKAGPKEIHFAFMGKSKVRHAIELRAPKLAKVVKRCRDLPGQQLFQYLDEEGGRHDVNSADVNDYLRELCGQPFTAKDFRTWAGTLIATCALQKAGDSKTKAGRNKEVLAAIDEVAESLGSTPSVCRKCYIHPAVIEDYLDGTLAQHLRQRVQKQVKSRLRHLPQEEQRLLAFLYRRLEKPARAA